MKTVIVTGGTGLVGRVLVKKLLQQDYKVIVLTRDKTKDQKIRDGCIYSYWNIETGELDTTVLSNADAVIHLAGAGVADKRWSAKRKQEILDSRTKSGYLLSEHLLKRAVPLKVFLSASAIGWYGADPRIPNPIPFTEAQPPANDFLGSTCYQWELSTQRLLQAGIRTVYLRTGIVLSNEAGALPEFKKPLKMRLAAIPGSGKQLISWIHIDDLADLYITAMQKETYAGVYNAVAPEPVPCKTLVLMLAKERCGSSFMKVYVPAWVLKLVLGEMSIEVLKSTTVSAQKITDTGFRFRFPVIQQALQDLAGNGSLAEQQPGM